MSGRSMSRALGFAAVATAASLVVSSPASANGCNGVVSPAEWGCAPWDNNNGPQFKHYRATPAAPSRAVAAPVVPGRNATVNNGAGIISNDGASVISNGSSGARPRGN